MNLPKSVEDPSLLQHEPLRNHVAMLEAVEGESRSRTKNVTACFVEAMRQNDKATEAAKVWASLVFEDVLSDKNSLESTDREEGLYKVFLKYQYLLHRGLLGGSINKAREYQAQVSRSGVSAMMLREHGAHRGKGYSNQSARLQKASGPKKARCQVETSVPRPDTGDVSTRLSIGRGFRTLGGSANDVPLSAGAILPAAVKSSNRSTSEKKKKRKASSQKPPVITPSDASEDDKEPSAVETIANATSHRPKKRFATNPHTQPPLVLAADSKFRANKKNLAHGPQTNKQRPGDTGISQPQPTLTSFRSDEFLSSPSIEGGCGVEFPLNDHNDNETRILNLSAQPTKTRFNSKRPYKMKSVRDLQKRATKRLRRASLSALNGKLGEESKPTYGFRTKVVQESTTQGPLVTGTSFAQVNTRVESKARRKRTRTEFETEIVVSRDKTSADSHEYLGPDIRLLRPLPQKVRDKRSVPVADEGAAFRGVPFRAPSLEHTEFLLQDSTSNTMDGLCEEVGPYPPDWTQDEGHDGECDDLCEHGQDETNDVQVATATSALSIVISKPPVPAPPRIWAQSRQEVCESFEYFRCYHSGVYSKDDIVKGYLLGAHAASRDIFHHGGKLIISHGGGKSESILDSRKGPRRYQTDQDQEASDKSVRALLKTCRDRRPIALLADDKYALFPYDLASANYTYVVLGFYWISHAWAECQPSRDGSGRIVRWKFAFQWCEGQSDPWWAPQQEMMDKIPIPSKSISNSKMCLKEGSQHPADAGGDSSVQCETCGEQSPFVYKQGWMCLNPRCDAFWSLNGEDPKQLDYREGFLGLLPRTFERLPDLTPARVVETSDRVTTTYAFSKGWHCGNCGRLSCRYKWEHWECLNCQRLRIRMQVKAKYAPPKSFGISVPRKVSYTRRLGKTQASLLHVPNQSTLGHTKDSPIVLLLSSPMTGKIHLILGTPFSNGDADGIFALYQQQASTGELKLRRYPLRNHRARGLLLTNYFSQNSGEPYQYVGGSGHTVPLHEAPDCVQRALALIKERACLALQADIPFNEVLSAAYMERQKMAFHSDNEKGLGPIVASLSLGSAAVMHFRPHVNAENPMGKAAHALTLVLRHGDVLVMEGGGVQKHYEHTVVPMNFRIAATARCIGST